MPDLFTFLLEANITLMILYSAYKIFFEKDRNFKVRRIFLLAVIILPFILALLPDFNSLKMGTVPIASFTLEEITVFGQTGIEKTSGGFSLSSMLLVIYLGILGIGLLKLGIQLVMIGRAIRRSGRYSRFNTTLLASERYHASSFFSYIFIDPARADEENIAHILEHESIHHRQWHSVDRIIMEIFILVNWFNPVSWLVRRSVIQNLEYLADSAVMTRGTDPLKYQLSILNQYIGSASITNQFNSQIKNRIKMLNRNYKIGSSWKIAMLLPFAVLAFIFTSCTEKESASDDTLREVQEEAALQNAGEIQEVFYIVEEMPTFNGGDAAMEFRKYIARNLIYPKEAVANGVSGKIFISFIVDKNGKVVVPDQETLAKAQGKPLDEVVVVSYRPLEEKEGAQDEKYIQMLKDEAVRVVESSPAWTPGKQGGKEVAVMYTTAINFALQ